MPLTILLILMVELLVGVPVTFQILDHGLARAAGEPSAEVPAATAPAPASLPAVPSSSAASEAAPAGPSQTQAAAATVTAAAAAAAPGDGASVADAGLEPQPQQQQQLTPEEAAIRDLSLEMKPRRSVAKVEQVEAPKAGSVILVATDVCLKALPRSVLPVGLPLLIQFDMPATKVGTLG